MNLLKSMTDDYETIEEIERYGRHLRRVRDIKTKEIFLMKMIPYSSLADLEKVKKEADLLKSLEHPFVVSFEGFAIFDMEGFKVAAIIMENLTGGNLMDHLEDRKTRDDLPTSEWSQALIGQLIEATSYCHSKGVVHRDLKPENIFLSEDKLTMKLGDFGISEEIVKTRKTGIGAGTDLYRPPESIRNLEHELSFRTDIWSIGIVIHQIVTLRHPFEGQDHFETLMNIVNGKRTETESVMERLLLKCLQVDPSKRVDNSSVLADDEFINKTCRQLRNYVKPQDLEFGITETRMDKLIIKGLQEMCSSIKKENSSYKEENYSYKEETKKMRKQINDLKEERLKFAAYWNSTARTFQSSPFCGVSGPPLNFQNSGKSTTPGSGSPFGNNNNRGGSLFGNANPGARVLVPRGYCEGNGAFGNSFTFGGTR